MTYTEWLIEDAELVALERVIVADDALWAGEPAVKRLRCPECADTYQGTAAPQTVTSEDDYSAGWGGRGPVLVVPMVGNCGHAWALCFGFHKGETFAFVRVPRNRRTLTVHDGGTA
jgi:hypothetical protein